MIRVGRGPDEARFVAFDLDPGYVVRTRSRTATKPRRGARSSPPTAASSRAARVPPARPGCAPPPSRSLDSIRSRGGGGGAALLCAFAVARQPAQAPGARPSPSGAKAPRQASSAATAGFSGVGESARTTQIRRGSGVDHHAARWRRRCRRSRRTGAGALAAAWAVRSSPTAGRALLGRRLPEGPTLT
jgi:hypothetical protein